MQNWARSVILRQEYSSFILSLITIVVLLFSFACITRDVCNNVVCSRPSHCPGSQVPTDYSRPNNSTGLVCSRHLPCLICWRLALLPVSKDDTRFWKFPHPLSLTFDLLNWKLALYLLVPWGCLSQFWFFCFCLWVKSPYRTDRWARRKMRSIKWLYNRSN